MLKKKRQKYARASSLDHRVITTLKQSPNTLVILDEFVDKMN